LLEAGDQAQEGRLARPGRSYDGGSAVGRHDEIHTFHRPSRAIEFRDS
jgi:hypothetical protein